MTLPSWHRILNSSPGGLRPSTLPTILNLCKWAGKQTVPWKSTAFIVSHVLDLDDICSWLITKLIFLKPSSQCDRRPPGYYIHGWKGVLSNNIVGLTSDKRHRHWTWALHQHNGNFLYFLGKCVLHVYWVDGSWSIISFADIFFKY